jgi:predicted GIY-YIG superfamily endonuclease
MGTIYLIHFDTPYKHARHYLGYASNLAARLALHRASNGARLIEVINAAGITWQVSRTWSGNRALERKLKNQKNGPRLCPLCNPKLN